MNFSFQIEKINDSNIVQKFGVLTNKIIYSAKKVPLQQLELRINFKELFCYLQPRIIQSILFWKRKRKNETKYLSSQLYQLLPSPSGYSISALIRNALQHFSRMIITQPHPLQHNPSILYPLYSSPTKYLLLKSLSSKDESIERGA